MSSKTFAYIRVSSKDQNLARQIDAIKQYCASNDIQIDDRDIYQDKQSGKDMDRVGYQALRHNLREGDTLIVKELDRLGRNKADIKAELDHYRATKVRVKILNIPTTLIDLPQGQEWVFDMINNILIEVLGAIAEEERNKIKTRQAEGIESMPVNENGVKYSAKTGKTMGRPKVDYPTDWELYYNQWKSKDITASAMMKALDMKRTTFYKLVKDYEQEKGL